VKNCVEVDVNGTVLRRDLDWQDVLSQAAAIRLVLGVDRAGLTLYEVDHAPHGETHRYLAVDYR
jgi:hypothetical protein